MNMPIQKLMIKLIIVITTFQFFSCQKFLDKKSDKSLVVPASVDDLQGILDDNYYMNSKTPGFGESSSDDYFISETDYNSLDDLYQKVYTWSVTDYAYENDWAYSYNAIYNANYCLEQIEKVVKTKQNEAKWNNVKGAALFFRAYYFLDLTWEYGKAYDDSTSKTDPGIVLRLTSDFNKHSARATVQESYQQVINDLQMANNYLPLTGTHPMRPGKAASYATLARTYLSMRKYDSAFKYSNLCLQIQNFLLDYNSTEINASSDAPFRPFNKEIIFYTTQSGSYPTKYSYYAMIDSSLFNAYDDNDLRKSIYYFSNNGYQSFKGHYTGDMYTFFSGIAVDEMYLIRAECNARAGRLENAKSDLDTLLVKRWKAGTFISVNNSDPEEIIQLILLERRKELVMRALRWIDIKRLNKEKANIRPERRIGSKTYSLDPNSGKYALPIPSDIINQTGIQQNK